MKLLMVAVTVTIKHKNNDRQIEKDLRLVWGMFKCEFPRVIQMVMIEGSGE